MDQELEELESVLSEHFGRTPLNSQNSESDDDLEELQANNLDDLVDGRTREYVQNHESDGSDAENEDEPSLVVEDNDGLRKIQHFLASGCGCHLNCHAIHTLHEIYDQVLNVREMTKDEKELYIMGAINDNVSQETTKRGKKRQRMRYTFRFRGHVVCKGTFLLCYDIGRTSLQNILSHVSQHGVTPRKHGNAGKVKPHSLKYDDVQRVVRFIANHADIHGIPQPAAPRGRDNIPPVYLSAETTKVKLHADYVAASANVDPPVRTVKLSSFKTIWLSCLPHIKIASPRDDVCAICEKLRKRVTDAVDEESKLSSTTELRDHILQAQQERDVYNTCIRRSIDTRDLQGNDKYTHYTFDFSQGVGLPHFYRQMGPL